MSRVVTNYARLAAGLIAGMLMVRALLPLGPEAFGVVLVLGAVTGVAGSIQDFLTTAFVPELGAAYHSLDRRPDNYVAVYRAAMRIAWRFAAWVAIAFVAIALLAPLFRFPTEMVWGARWFLVARGFEWAVAVSLAPHRSMLLVSERTAHLNGWVVVERFADVAAAAIALAIASPERPGLGIALYGFLGASLTCAVMAAASAPVRRSYRALGAGQQLDTDSALTASLRRSIASNSAVGIAMNLYLRAALLIVQIAVGSTGAYSFGLAAQFGFYLRQAGMGLVLGIDGVAARVTGNGDQNALAKLIRSSTRWQAAVLIPGGVLVFVFTEDWLKLWAGPRILESPDLLAEISLLVRVLLLGVTARALSEAWMRTLTGVGKAALIAQPVVAGAFASPVACGIGVVLAPPEWDLVAVASALSVTMLAVHTIAIPLWAAGRLGLSVGDFLSPILGPLTSTTFAVASTVAFGIWSAAGPSAWVTMGVFSVAYTLAAGMTVVDVRRLWRLNVAAAPLSPSPSNNAASASSK